MWLALASLAAMAAATPPTGRCQAAPSGRIVQSADGQPIFVRTIGEGRPVLMIPSLARGSHDFDALAQALAEQGFMSILPDPRGTGNSTREQAKDLFALADDGLSAVQALCAGRVDVLGHAFGNRVARSLATKAPDRVGSVILLAGGGEAPMTDETKRALQGSVSEGRLPDDERLRDLGIAFFAKDQNPRVWLTGWYPDAAVLQQKAMANSPPALWWKAGSAPVLLVQAMEDPVAPPGNADALKRDLGDRLTLVRLAHASHAILPEQPAAVAAVVADYLKGERDETKLQVLVDRTIVTP